MSTQIPLSSGAVSILQNGFGNGTSAYNALVNAVQNSSYLAGLLNQFAANGGSFEIGARRKLEPRN